MNAKRKVSQNQIENQFVLYGKTSSDDGERKSDAKEKKRIICDKCYRCMYAEMSTLAACALQIRNSKCLRCAEHVSYHGKPDYEPVSCALYAQKKSILCLLLFGLFIYL